MQKGVKISIVSVAALAVVGASVFALSGAGKTNTPTASSAAKTPASSVASKVENGTGTSGIAANGQVINKASSEWSSANAKAAEEAKYGALYGTDSNEMNYRKMCIDVEGKTLTQTNEEIKQAYAEGVLKNSGSGTTTKSGTTTSSSSSSKSSGSTKSSGGTRFNGGYTDAEKKLLQETGGMGNNGKDSDIEAANNGTFHLLVGQQICL